MTRHGKNCTAGSVYTYHERQKDTAQSGYGSQQMRFGKDSLRNFDCCCLSLQPCKNPVITPDGYLYDKEYIIENILHQKRENARKMKEFEKQKNKQAKEASELGQAEQESKLQKFLAREGKLACTTDDKHMNGAGASGAGTSGALSNMTSGKDKKLPSFWVPSLTPQSKENLVKKPDDKVKCPMSGKSLKLKNLFDIKFTPIPDGDEKSAVIIKEARYVCAVTNDVLGNSVPVVVLKTSGCVVTVECLEKIIRKDMVDPTNGKKLVEKDLIFLQRGATGFAATGVDLKAKIDGPAIQA